MSIRKCFSNYLSSWYRLLKKVQCHKLWLWHITFYHSNIRCLVIFLPFNKPHNENINHDRNLQFELQLLWKITAWSATSQSINDKHIKWIWFSIITMWCATTDSELLKMWIYVQSSNLCLKIVTFDMDEIVTYNLTNKLLYCIVL